MDISVFFELYWQYIVAVVFFVLGVVSFIVTLFTKRNVSQAIKSFNEVDDMKTKYLNSETRLRSSQSFSETVPDYVLSGLTGELERSPIDKNIQKYIDSYIDTALARALERFSVPNAIDEDVVEDYTQKVDDLSSLGEAIEIAETYREKFALPDSASVSDIYKFVDSKARELKDKIEILKSKEVSSKSEEKKEVE